jgi:hypothetical protein
MKFNIAACEKTDARMIKKLKKKSNGKIDLILRTHGFSIL